MSDQAPAAPSAAEPELVPAAPPVAEQIKTEEEIWSEIQAEKEPATAASEQQPAAAPEPAPVSEPDPAAPAADIWANATPEQKAAFEAAQADAAEKEKRLRSSYGRVSALQRKINAAQPSREASNARDEIAGIRNDYPEIAEPLTKALDKIDGKLDHLSKAETSDVEAARTELAGIVEQEASRLAARHPDYVAVLKANGPAFKAWVDDQPLRIRQAAVRNAENIFDADGAIEVVEGFKKHLGLDKAPAPAPTPAPAPSPASQPTLDDRRQRQIAASASPQRSGGRATVSGIPAEGDEDAIWNAIQAEKAQKGLARV